MEQLSEYATWEGQVTRIIEEKAECTTSDAQGIVEASEFIIAQSWGKALSPEETASKILNSQA